METGIERKLLTIKDTVRALALSRASIYRALSRGDLQSVKYHGARRIVAASIDSFIAKQRAANGADHE